MGAGTFKLNVNNSLKRELQDFFQQKENKNELPCGPKPLCTSGSYKMIDQAKQCVMTFLWNLRVQATLMLVLEDTFPI